MSEHARRLGYNEAVFRSVNERLEDLNEAFQMVTDRFEIVCECGSTTCVERISISGEEYHELRADPSAFAMIAGHDDPAVEQIVERRGDYNRVRKRPGEPETIAEGADPRG
ncbi:MAG: hypothetical protein M3M94_06345 [Actinomycetota bacterium]|nr:hypothetical protein [Actinomycetota bacterium]